MKFESLLACGVVLLIKLYRVTVSPLLRPWMRCRFHPTCSEYAIMAFQEVRSRCRRRKTVGRLKRCRPDNIETCIDFRNDAPSVFVAACQNYFAPKAQRPKML